MHEIAGYRIGDGLVGERPNAAHVNLYIGRRDGPLGSALVSAAASSGPGQIPFLATLKRGVPVRPYTLMVSKAAIRDDHHAEFIWGPAQAGVAKGITRGALDARLTVAALVDWAIVACVWVSPDSADANAVFSNNELAAYQAFMSAMADTPPDIEQLRKSIDEASNAFYPKR